MRPSFWCAWSSSELITGDRVSATTPDTITAPARVRGELAEQRAGEAAHRPMGVYGGQGDGHGDHRAGHFAGADQRRRHRRLAFLDVAVDVLHHHDGVVHHQPDGQHHRQQGQQVDAEAEGQHQRGGAEHRQGNGRHRDQHAAQRAEAEVDHQHHDQQRFHQGPHHLVDGGLDEARSLVGEVDADIRRQGLLDLRQQLADAVDDHQRVAGGRRNNPGAPPGRRPSVRWSRWPRRPVRRYRRRAGARPLPSLRMTISRKSSTLVRSVLTRTLDSTYCPFTIPGAAW